VAGVFLAAGQPVISVDTKKKELVGRYANGGREWQRPSRTGVYDVGADDGFVSVGVDHDTAAFAVNAIQAWWFNVGRDRYPNADRLLITADCGGSNGNRPWAWKAGLAELAAETGLHHPIRAEGRSGAGHQHLPDRRAHPTRTAEGDPVAALRLPRRVELHHPQWTDLGIGTEQGDSSRINQVLLDQALSLSCEAAESRK
jgi:hypothetical protein